MSVNIVDASKFSIKQLEELLEDLRKQKFYGKLQLDINFFKGGISSASLKSEQTFKKLELSGK